MPRTVPLQSAWNAAIATTGTRSTADQAVCQLHFTADDFSKWKLTKHTRCPLNVDAVPSIFPETSTATEPIQGGSNGAQDVADDQYVYVMHGDEGGAGDEEYLVEIIETPDDP